MRSTHLAILGCLAACACAYAQENGESQPGSSQMLIAYNVDRQALNHTFGCHPIEEPYARNSGSWCLVINSKDQAIAWRDPNRPFDRIVHTISIQRLNTLYRQVSDTGMERFSRPTSAYPKAIDALRQIRPDRVRILPSATEIAGVAGDRYFTIGLGGRITDYDAHKDDETLAAVRRSLAIMRQVYDEVLDKGKPEKIDYVRHLYWDGHSSIGRGETVECIVVADGHVTTWGWGARGRRLATSPISNDAWARLSAQLRRSGLFDLKPLTTVAQKTIYGSVTTIEARIDGQEIRAIATPAITEILTGLRRDIATASGK